MRVLMATLIVGMTVASSLGARQGSVTIEPDPRVQTLIRETLVGLNNPSLSEGDIEAALGLLDREASRDRREFLLQLSLFLKSASGTEEAMGGAAILNRLSFSRDEKIDALLPHLRDAEPALKHVFDELLSTIDRPNGGQADFHYYESVIQSKGIGPCSGLILYMYETSPGDALLTMLDLRVKAVSERQAVLSSKQGIDDFVQVPQRQALSDRGEAKARLSLEMLSRNQDWCVRLYAAAIFGRFPALGSADLAKRLTTDPSELVRSIIGEQKK